jgi:hypothetical protein
MLCLKVFVALGDAGILSASKGEDTFGIFDRANPLVFTTSFVDGNSEQSNLQIHCDADWIFFVWDNLTTGHICNGIWTFVPGTIQQPNKSLATENGIGSCLQDGPVKI